MFIKLTDALQSDAMKRPPMGVVEKLIEEKRQSEIPTYPQEVTYVDAGKITYMWRERASITYPMGCTQIIFDNERHIFVQETPEEILDIIFDIKESKRVAKRMLREEYRRRRKEEEET